MTSGSEMPGVLAELDHSTPVPSQATERPPKWAKLLDQSRCIGCHACTTACKSENEVPIGVTRTYVKAVDVGFFPKARRNFQVTRCNMCEDAPCVNACPTSAMYQRNDGLVDFDKSACIGCKACIAACPYDAIFINPEDHSAEKCNFCSHRLDMGLEPACVVVCPVEAIVVGDVNDPTSRVSQVVNRDAVAVRRPEKETKPKVFYKGAHQTTLDPLAARRPEGDTYMWSQRRKASGSQQVESGHPAPWKNSSAAAVVAYDVPHKAPWDWRVSLYTWTKSIAAGIYIVPILLAFLGFVGWGSDLVRWVAPLGSLFFLAVTGALLIWDLTHPTRFYMIFTRPQWGSWLVRGAFIIAGFGGVLSVHLLSSILGESDWIRAAAIPGIPLATMTAVYTAYLFAQSKARDLWQSPLLPPHMFVQMILAGTAAVMLSGTQLSDRVASALEVALLVAAATHLSMVLGEITLHHPTAHAHLATWEMTHGRYRAFFWAAALLMVVALFAPLMGPAAGLFALAGLLAHEHAYVQAAQIVPLA